MNQDPLYTFEDDIKTMVERFGIALIVDAVLALASGESIQDIAERVERRAIRLAADAEANLLLK